MSKRKTKKRKDFVLRELEKMARKTVKIVQKTRQVIQEVPEPLPPSEAELEAMARKYESERGAELLTKDALAERGI